MAVLCMLLSGGQGVRALLPSAASPSACVRAAMQAAGWSGLTAASVQLVHGMCLPHVLRHNRHALAVLSGGAAHALLPVGGLKGQQ
jgi:hypothetical protein